MDDKTWRERRDDEAQEMFNRLIELNPQRITQMPVSDTVLGDVSVNVPSALIEIQRK